MWVTGYIYIKDWKEEVFIELSKVKPDKYKMKELYKEMHSNLCNTRDPFFGSFRKTFAEVGDFWYI